MKNIFYKPILACTMLLVIMFSCAKDELPLFDTEISNVYFEWAKEGKAGIAAGIDSLNISFAFEAPTVIDSVVQIPVKIQGYTAKTDRIVNLKILASTTAQQGIHYDMPETVVLPADSVKTYVPVTLKRDASLKQGEVSLKFALVANQYFNTDILNTQETLTGNRVLSYTEFELIYSDVLTQPEWWAPPIVTRYMGDWSAKKMQLLSELSGVPLSVLALPASPSVTEVFSYTRILRDYLKAQKAAGTPVYEDDGVTEMTVGPYANYV